MPYYECRVRSAQSEPKTLQIEAPSLQAALEQLHRDGYFVVQVREKRTRARTDTPSWLQLSYSVGSPQTYAIPLRALDPPTTFPRGEYMRCPFIPDCGSVSKRHA